MTYTYKCNLSWYHFDPSMSVEGFSNLFNVVNFVFKSRYIYMCIYCFIRKTIGRRSFFWRLRQFVSWLSNILKVSLLINVKNDLTLDLCNLKSRGFSSNTYATHQVYVVNCAQDFFFIDSHQTPCLIDTLSHFHYLISVSCTPTWARLQQHLNIIM